jgi:hypothetical protein
MASTWYVVFGYHTFLTQKVNGLEFDKTTKPRAQDSKEFVLVQLNELLPVIMNWQLPQCGQPSFENICNKLMSLTKLYQTLLACELSEADVLC